MITDKKTFKEYNAADLEVAYVPKNKLKRFVNTVGGNEQCATFRYVRRLRKTEYYLNTHKRLRYHLSHFLQNHLGLRYGISIAPNRIGK